MNVERLTELARVKAVAPSPDGRWLAVEVARLARDESRYVSDLWRVEVDGGAPPRRLTWGEASDGAPRFRRDGSLGFVSSRPTPEDEKGKRAQVWLLPAGGGEPAPLTDEPLGVLDFRFAAEADCLVVLSEVLAGVEAGEQRAEAEARERRGPTAIRFTETPVRFWDHWLGGPERQMFAYDESGGGRRALTPEATSELIDSGFGLGWDLAADGSRLVTEWWSLGEDRLTDAALALIDVASGERQILAKEPRTAFLSPRFDAAGRRVVCVAEGRELEAWRNPELTLVEPQGSRRRLAAELDAVVHEPRFLDADTVAFVAEVGAEVPVYAVRAAGDAPPRRLTAEAAGGSHGGLSIAGEHIVGLRHRLIHPPEPFICPAAGGEPRLVAELSGFGRAEGAELASIERRRTRADDGADICWLWLRPASARGPVPAILWIHGGPMTQWADGWHWRWNPLVMVAAGYGVAMPNPRGSTGFGEAFTNGVWNNRWGAECYRDLMAVTDDLVELGDVQRDRVAAMGGSFGGYMANWIGGQTDRFACLVSHAGIYDFATFQPTTDAPPFFTLALGGHDRGAPEMARYSPHRNIEAWKTPVLIIHGEKDYRVPISEALILFEELRARGKPAELLVFPDENHWILRPHNIRAWYGEVLRFIGDHTERAS